jgi:hypothetical protein
MNVSRGDIQVYVYSEAEVKASICEQKSVHKFDLALSRTPLNENPPDYLNFLVDILI